jgi:carbon-monoxide dehydrogenase large subunit
VAYRGAGRPEATYVIERLIDDAARELGFDPVELRTKNLIPASALPYKTALNLNYDCGDFTANQQKALTQAERADFPARRDEAKARGKLRGIGIVNPIEKAVAPGQEFAEIRFHPSGNATLLLGSKNQGQGHETTFKQVLNEKFGLDAETSESSRWISRGPSSTTVTSLPKRRYIYPKVTGFSRGSHVLP